MAKFWWSTNIQSIAVPYKHRCIALPTIVPEFYKGLQITMAFFLMAHGYRLETQTRKAVFLGVWTNLKFQPGLSDLPSRLNSTIGFGISEVQALSKTFGNFFELAIDLHPQPLTTSLRLLDHLAWPPLTALGRPTVQVGLPQIALKLMPIAAIRAMATSARAAAIIK